MLDSSERAMVQAPRQGACLVRPAGQQRLLAPHLGTVRGGQGPRSIAFPSQNEAHLEISATERCPRVLAEAPVSRERVGKLQVPRALEAELSQVVGSG